MNISKREMVLSLITLALILVALSWYVLTSKISEWKEMKEQIAQTEREIRLRKKAIEMSGTWKSKLDVLQKDLLVFQSGDHSVAPDLLKIIKQISRKHSLEITRTQPSPEKGIGDLYEMGINCTWQGPLKAIVNFLADLQLQGARYDVRSLTISPIGKNQNMLKGNMVIHCAYKRTPVSAKK